MDEVEVYTGFVECSCRQMHIEMTYKNSSKPLHKKEKSFWSLRAAKKYTFSPLKTVVVSI
jgi:hypothetical protein